MKVPPALAEVRKRNLKKYIDEKFDGNRAAFARASGKNSNLIVLVLSNNPEIVRSIGERLAREIEQKMGLPAGWMDLDSGAPSERFSTIPIISLDNMSQTIEKLFLSDRVLNKSIDTPTSIHAVRGLYMPSKEMQPAISQDDILLVDTGCETYPKDGVYVIRANKSVFVRRVRRLLTGNIRISADADADSAVEVSPSEYRPAGRVVGMLRFGQP